MPRIVSIDVQNVPLASFLTCIYHERQRLLSHRAGGNAAMPLDSGRFTTIGGESVEPLSIWQRENPLFMPQMAACVRLWTRILRRIDLT